MFDRLHEDTLTFAEQLLKKVLLRQSTKDFTSSLFTCFSKVISQDKTILPLVSAGNLVIRDQGYYSLAVFEQLIKTKVHIVSRVRYGLWIADKKGKPISPKTLLKQKHGVDRWVYIDSDRKVLFRLVMIPMPAAKMAERVGKAKSDRDARLNHSNEYNQWLRFGVYYKRTIERKEDQQKTQPAMNTETAEPI